MGFFAGVATTILVAVFLCVTFPIWWLLTGGDFDFRHPWLGDADPHGKFRWRWPR